MSVAIGRRSFFVLGSSAALTAAIVPSEASACCPAGPENKPVVNADQTVIIVWDAATKTQHFIRQASFRGMSSEFGFLIPTPTAPALDESGDAAFPLLAEITAPKQLPMPPQGCDCGCWPTKGGEEGSAVAVAPVRVLSEQAVAGFNATVLEASSASALVGWLKDRGFAFSPEVEAWAKPYVDGGWKITALRVLGKEPEGGSVEAKALRMSFETERPLFPYREPAPPSSDTMGTLRSRMLRIYFLSDGRYEGTLTPEVAWTGRVAHSGKVDSEALAPITSALGIPPLAATTEWWLTEFEDLWPYKLAPADLYFAKADRQETIEREPHYGFLTDGERDVRYALATAALLPIVRRLVRSKPLRQ